MTSELHTYLALAGNQRLEHLEEEIFADKAATTIYLHNLCRDLGPASDCSSTNNAHHMYCYAKEVMKTRWPPAEHLIIKHPGYACAYAIIVIKDRWLEAESVIATDQYYCAAYTETFHIKQLDFQ